jgi:hypothetical protein
MNPHHESVLNDLKLQLVAGASVTEALSELSRHYGLDAEDIRLWGEHRYGDLEAYSWRVSGVCDAQD